MKIRSDFVTNSSSSSYILCNPSKSDGVIFARNYLKNTANELLELIQTMDDLMYKNSIVGNKLKLFRSLDVNDETYESKYYELIKKLSKMYSFKNRLKKHLGILGINLRDYGDFLDNSISLDDFIYCYLDKCCIDGLIDIAKDNITDKLIIVDLDSNTVDDAVISEVYDWYFYIPDYGLTDIPNNKNFTRLDVIKSVLGSIILYSNYGEGTLPHLLEEYLSAKLKYTCRHMG